MDISVIEPFPFEALPRVWRWIEQFRNKVTDDFGPRTLPAFMESMGAQWDGQRSWGVWVDGELGGLITFQQLSPWLGTAHCIFKTDFQGKGISLKACAIAVAAMFETGIGKLTFYPLAGNLAIGSLVCNLGAKREGTLVAQTLVDGAPTDILVYGLTKENFNAISHSRGGRGRRVDLRLVHVGPTENNDDAKLDNSDVQRDGKCDEQRPVIALEPAPDGSGGGNASD